LIEIIKNLLKIQFLRFLLVGGLNTLFGYSVFALLIFLKFHYAVAALISTTAGVIFNFQTVGRLVFNEHNLRLIFRFFAVYAVVYGLNVLGLKLFDIVHVSAYISGAILILPLAALSFVLNKLFVFNKKKPGPGSLINGF
jgi:putative flippase GtrA